MEIAALGPEQAHQQVTKQADRKSLGNEERIDILLEEYKTLRTEILQRHSAIMQFISIVGTGLGAAIAFAFVHKALPAAAATLVTLLFAIGSGLLWLDNDLRLLSARIQEIEDKVNRLADDRLLVWETTRGMNKLGYRERIKQTLRRWKT